MAMIFAKLNADGTLTDIRSGPQQPGGVWPDGSQDVPLVTMPTSPTGTKYTYDSQNQLAVPVAARKPRRPYDVAVAIAGLSTAQWNNVVADLFAGSPAKWQLDNGPYAVSIGAGACFAIQSNGAFLFNKFQQFDLAAIYCVDNPTYLVNPSFDPTINIPGDQPA